MSDDPKLPLPWETNAALGALFLLGVQWIHETWLLCADLRAPGYGDERSAAPVCLVMIVAAVIGLRSQSRTAWWCAVSIPGIIGILFLLKTWEPITAMLPWMSGIPRDYNVGNAGFRRSAIWVSLFWMSARVGLHLAVPFFLMLEWLRERLRAA